MAEKIFSALGALVFGGLYAGVFVLYIIGHGV